MLKSHLMTPGPTMVPERIALAMAQPIVHHRSVTFEALMGEVREGLRWLFATQEDVLAFTCSGSGALEGAVTNFLKRGERALVIDGGLFGARWANICQAFGVDVQSLKVEWGDAVDPAQVEEALKADPSIRAVLMQSVESSTGVLHPVKEVAALVRGREDVLVMVDAVSSLGACDVPMDSWGIDVLVAASQKGLMLPPGLAFGAASPRAWRRNESADLPRFYFEWRREREMQRKNQTTFTPAVALMMGLQEAIRWLRSEGKEETYARHDRMARAARAGMTALGLPLYAKRPAPSITTVAPPVDADKLIKVLRERYGVTLMGGQDQAKGKIFRMAHIGYCDESDIAAAVAAVERALCDVGYRVELGVGVGAALNVFGSR